MRERKYVKFRVDMYADTKFKIIDMKPERDVIHYVWNRIVLLAGKVNLEGDLYLSKSIPYTIETLAIEFNRDITQIKLALKVLIELEMIELSEDKIYRVRNFAKHQGIKVKEKEISNDKEEDEKNINASLDENFKVGISDDKDIIKVEDSIEEEKGRESLQADIPIILRTKKGTKRNKKQKDEIIESIGTNDEIIDNSICCTQDGDTALMVDEISISKWSYG